jgi:hypothetical protein
VKREIGLLAGISDNNTVSYSSGAAPVSKLGRLGGSAMGSSDWFESETLSDEITHSQARLEAART